MSEKLKPCPFCGSNPVLDKVLNILTRWRVVCTGCLCQTDSGYEKEVVADWNKRHFAEDCTQKDLEMIGSYNRELAAENKKLRSLIREASNYLDTNELTSISNSSILHRKFKEAV